MDSPEAWGWAAGGIIVGWRNLAGSSFLHEDYFSLLVQDLDCEEAAVVAVAVVRLESWYREAVPGGHLGCSDVSRHVKEEKRRWYRALELVGRGSRKAGGERG